MDKLYRFESDPIFKIQEKIPTLVFDTSVEASLHVANMIAVCIREKNASGQKCVLGLATGSTPLRVYAELIRLHKEQNLSFRNVITFNLDEYYPVHPKSLQSYHRFMHENFFSEIDILPENINIPDGTIPRSQVDDFCKQYEEKIKAAGGIDFQILGIGKTGHIGFNEPGSSVSSTTRLIYLDNVTITDAASDFFGVENVPRKAITMGVQTILGARKIVVMAFQEQKANIVKKAVEGEVTSDVPCSYLQDHKNAYFIMDRAASEKLTRFHSPWTIKGVSKQMYLDFDDFLKKKAVIWLSQHLQKAISKLTEQDYEEYGLHQLLEEYPDITELNDQILDSLREKVQMYPLGKNAPKKKVLVFSPHPDDDVICMAGTMTKMSKQGHEVHVAYQTSGNVGVFDHDALRFTNFLVEAVKKLGFDNSQQVVDFENKVKDAFKVKKSGQVDIPETLAIKGLIRQTEAFSAARLCGCAENHIYNLDLPFYETGKVKKKPIGEKDIQITRQLLDEVQPDYIFAAGDLTDPHGTHRQCLIAILRALNDLDKEKVEWYKNTQVFLYRGAWQEWEIEKVSLAIPLNPEQLYHKRMAIFKHQSQKDKALFPGFDPREFWQRAEERNLNTAKLYNQMGLNEYQAMEVFVNLKELAKLIKIDS